jgi:hypothetical protein
MQESRDMMVNTPRQNEECGTWTFEIERARLEPIPMSSFCLCRGASTYQRPPIVIQPGRHITHSRTESELQRLGYMNMPEIERNTKLQ